MRTLNYYCDRCNKEVTEKELTNNLINTKINPALGRIVKINVELCSECQDKLEKWITNKESVKE